MHAYPQHQKHHYLADILQALHLTMDQFIYNPIHHSHYETILFRWILKLYQKQTPAEHAIQVIYITRNTFVLEESIGVKN
ncbi:hypothetical protein [Aquimarina mytili]|uniref:Uncharacterized protein n=1 Tax=Aquimarina mytili TaxID=874423 RepID=A0A936ZW58_9FLAO|nr:hypothetical protein [Aquimarina mytili]MBL0685788.1 hypothetical protein [Aquimarina mytili]